ncbi:MAG TPA: hypothetical protein VF729_07460 [Solirubrobacterales bacterium]
MAGLLALTSLAPAASQPRLSYAKAKRVVQSAANNFAGTVTQVTVMYRLGDLTWSARAEWTRENPKGCVGCGFDPVTGDFYDTPTTESCTVGLRAKQLRSGRVRVSTEDFSCY